MTSVPIIDFYELTQLRQFPDIIFSCKGKEIQRTKHKSSMNSVEKRRKSGQ